MTQQPRQRLLLLVAGACVFLLAADRFVLTPVTGAWKKRSARIAELKQSIDKGEILIDRRDSLQSRWDEIRRDALPANGPAAENRVLTAVNGWANDARFNVSALKPRWIDDEDFGPRMEVRVSGTGNLESVARFLYAVETSKLPLRLEDVELRARDDNGREIALDARFSGLTTKKLEGNT